MREHTCLLHLLLAIMTLNLSMIPMHIHTESMYLATTIATLPLSPNQFIVIFMVSIFFLPVLNLFFFRWVVELKNQLFIGAESGQIRCTIFLLTKNSLIKKDIKLIMHELPLLNVCCISSRVPHSSICLIIFSFKSLSRAFNTVDSYDNESALIQIAIFFPFKSRHCIFPPQLYNTTFTDFQVINWQFHLQHVPAYYDRVLVPLT